MFRLSSASPHRSNVTAFFRDGAQSFHLPAGETMGELAGRIEALAVHHAGSPIAIQVHFEASDGQPNSAAARH